LQNDVQRTSRRGLWRLASAAPLPLLILVYALWAELVTLNERGFHLTGRPAEAVGCIAMTLGTVLLVAALWAPLRALRILASALYSLVLAFGFGAAGVVAIVHAFGGPRGDLVAPSWAIVLLGLTSGACALALLALAALLVDEVQAADAGEP
jgi:hypothetical protein